MKTNMMKDNLWENTYKDDGVTVDVCQKYDDTAYVWLYGDVDEKENILNISPTIKKVIVDVDHTYSKIQGDNHLVVLVDPETEVIVLRPLEYFNIEIKNNLD